MFKLVVFLIWQQHFKVQSLCKIIKVEEIQTGVSGMNTVRGINFGKIKQYLSPAVFALYKHSFLVHTHTYRVWQKQVYSCQYMNYGIYSGIINQFVLFSIQTTTSMLLPRPVYIIIHIVVIYNFTFQFFYRTLFHTMCMCMWGERDSRQ